MFFFSKLKQKLSTIYTLNDIISKIYIDNISERIYNCDMTTIGIFIKRKRKEAHLTQADFAVKSGLGLKFVRDLEQGKPTVRLDKVNQALSMFGFEAGPVRKSKGETDE